VHPDERRALEAGEGLLERGVAAGRDARVGQCGPRAGVAVQPLDELDELGGPHEREPAVAVVVGERAEWLGAQRHQRVDAVGEIGIEGHGGGRVDQ
jgi:hypothetical protein